MPEEIRDLEDKKLSIYYMSNERILFDVKREISDHLYETLKIEIDNNRLNDTERFYEGIQNIEKHLVAEMKNEFIQALDIKRRLDKEIHRRQINMLRDIRIKIPSVYVLHIMKATQGQNFHIFSDMIKYIKLDNAGRTDNRPKGKKISLPPELIKLEEKIKTTTLTILARNLGPLGPCVN